MKLPREKTQGKHPKLTIDYDGPYRILDVSDTSALISRTGLDEEPIKVQYDLLLKCPDDVSNEPVNVRTRRKRVKKTFKVCCIRTENN